MQLGNWCVQAHQLCCPSSGLWFSLVPGYLSIVNIILVISDTHWFRASLRQDSCYGLFVPSIVRSLWVCELVWPLGRISSSHIFKIGRNGHAQSILYRKIVIFMVGAINRKITKQYQPKQSSSQHFAYDHWYLIATHFFYIYDSFIVICLFRGRF